MGIGVNFDFIGKAVFVFGDLKYRLYPLNCQFDFKEAGTRKDSGLFHVCSIVFRLQLSLKYKLKVSNSIEGDHPARGVPSFNAFSPLFYYPVDPS
jgi:hypothetical protein